MLYLPTPAVVAMVDMVALDATVVLVAMADIPAMADITAMVVGMWGSVFISGLDGGDPRITHTTRTTRTTPRRLSFNNLHPRFTFKKRLRRRNLDIGITVRNRRGTIPRWERVQRGG